MKIADDRRLIVLHNIRKGIGAAPAYQGYNARASSNNQSSFHPSLITIMHEEAKTGQIYPKSVSCALKFELLCT